MVISNKNVFKNLVINTFIVDKCPFGSKKPLKSVAQKNNLLYNKVTEV